MSPLAQIGAALLGGQLQSDRPLSGGDLSQVIRIELHDGRTAAVKTGPNPMAEAEMLSELSAAGIPVPEVIAVDEQALVLSWIDANAGAASAWASLGAVARRLHDSRHPQGRYGWQTDFAFGRAPIPNGWNENWPEFWSHRRLLPSASLLPNELRRRLESLARVLPERLPRKPAASLLHGDLWTGNVMASDGRVAALIDPACYYGHAEVDIAMLQLFGSPTPEFFDHYGALESGSIERLAIYRLWPALVHFRLFGPGYLQLIDEQLRIAGV